MQRLTLAGGIPEALRGAIVALGNFDGFHLGHQAVVGRSIQRGFHERRPVIVATFDPHPVRFFKPDVAPFRLTTLDQREALFAHAGADAMLVFEFDKTLCITSAEDFVDDVLAQQIGVAGVVTGDDFTFGRARKGNVETLRTLGQASGIVAEAVAPVALGDLRISSGRIREALQAGDTATATKLMSRDFAIEGIVQAGDKRGRELGYPTANIPADPGAAVPQDGVYAGWLTVLTPAPGAPAYPDPLPAAISVGSNPTFDGVDRRVESYVLDRDDLELYGAGVAIDFVARLRGTQIRFDSIDELLVQMKADVDGARRLLSTDPG